MSNRLYLGNRLSSLTQKLRLMQQFFSSLRKRLWRTLKMSIFEIYFEYKLGADTSYIISNLRLDGAEDAIAHATAYFPSSYLVLYEAFSRLGEACRDAVLVDYGSGMGRTLMFASTLPLKKLIGVEISKSLCDIAAASLSRLYRKSRRNKPPWLIVNADARLFEIPDEANIFYFFNPFDELVMGQVADRIVASVRRTPRKYIIVYANPVHESELISRGLLKVFARNDDFAVFENFPDMRSSPKTL
jgi:hypothetical protein